MIFTTMEVGAQIETYQQEGFVLLPPDAADCPSEELLQETWQDERVEKVYEQDEKTLRSIYGLQFHPPFAAWLRAQTWMEALVKGILGPEVYLHQSKINYKNKIETAVWPYHRDFPFWHFFDGIPQAQLLNVAIYLDAVRPDNGELRVIPKSHQHFLETEQRYQKAVFSLEGSSSADLLFDIKEEELAYFRTHFGECGSAGPRGSVLLFHPDIVHGSGPALTNGDRRLLILTWNRCDNAPLRESQRPAFLCARDTRPW